VSKKIPEGESDTQRTKPFFYSMKLPYENYITSTSYSECLIILRMKIAIVDAITITCQINRNQVHGGKNKKNEKIFLTFFPIPNNRKIIVLSPTHARVRDFPCKVPVRVKTPDAVRRPEYPDVIVSIAIPVANDGFVIS
jgi:hypothetical protein